MKSRVLVCICIALLTSCAAPPQGAAPPQSAAESQDAEKAQEWTLSIGFSGTTEAERLLADDLQAGRRSGPYAVTRNGSKYPLPGYVVVPKSELAEGIKIGIPGFTDDSRLVLTGPQRAIVEVGRKTGPVYIQPQSAPPDFLIVGIPVELFGPALASLPQTTTEQTAAYRKSLLEARRGPPAGAAIGAGVGAALGGSSRGSAAVVGGLFGAAIGALAGVSVQSAPHWNFKEPNALVFSAPNAPLIPEPSAPTLANFGYGPFDTHRWIFQSEPSDAELRGLPTSTTPRTDVRIINLAPEHASKTEMFAQGYAACPFKKKMSRQPVVYNGLEWLQLSCALKKLP